MKITPILFSAPMVRALREGRKTQTRRVIKPIGGEDLDPEGVYELHPGDLELARCPYGKPGDLLWVRETFGYVSPDENLRPISECTVEYRADLPEGSSDYPGEWPADIAKGDPDTPKWKPSIHMPRAASRLTLEITGVRVERLASITVADAIAEGIERTSANSFRSYLSGGVITAPGKDSAAVASYLSLWEAINGAQSLAANPWVYVIEFSVHLTNIDALLRERGLA